MLNLDIAPIENVDYCLKWGGLIHPHILQNKDYSMLSVISYQAYTEDIENVLCTLPELRNGWAYWTETQHINGKSKHFLIVYWNPFYANGDTITNYITGKVPVEKAREKFLDAVLKIFNTIFKVTPCYILEYQALISFLESAISLERAEIIMPPVPLYLDALLTQDIDFDFYENSILINHNRLAVISLPPCDENLLQIKEFLHNENLNYRHCQRLLVFAAKMAEKEKNNHTKLWCMGRPSIKELIVKDILNNLNGYYFNVLVIAINVEQYENQLNKIQELLIEVETPYMIEDYNLKEIWWASLPGMHEPYARPPITGFCSIDELLTHKRGDTENV